MTKKTKFIIGAIVAVFILFSTFFGLAITLYTNFLWFQSIDFSNVFKTIITTKVLIRLGLWIIFSLFIFLNLYFTKDKVLDFINDLTKKQVEEEDTVVELNQTDNNFLNFLSGTRLILLYLIVSAFIGFVFSSINLDSWKTVLKYINATSFNITDPLFNNDLSFYIFKLPLQELIYQLSSFLIILTSIIVAAIYLLTSSGASLWHRFKSNSLAKRHLSILVTLFFVIKAWGYRLDMFNLLYSDRGVAFGASYTDVHAQLFSLRILAIISLLLAAFIAINIFIKKFKLVIGGIATLVITSILLGTLYPAFVQQYQVEPNEIVKETPYIKYNINHTQQAYNLDEIKKRDFPVEENLTYEKLKNNKATYNNIRLWDSRPLKSTYSQLQEIRSYYTFDDIDVDRYQIDGELRQVMLGTRELDQDSLPPDSQTWVNKRLAYTHGFGVAMSPVSKKTPGGSPEFLMKDIPPESEGIKVEQPRIYYGEVTDDYVIANTKAQEFDYPQGDDNQYTSYKGSGGVKLSNLLRKLAFSFKYSTMKILLNNDITADSQLMFDRNIKGRVRKVAPFLQYDNDPYMVIADGKSYWIQDAYTTTNMYPYSEPQSWGNYIRNSVKVVIDAYTGKMKFYVVDDSDPLIKTYKKIFPKLFIDQEKMPDSLKSHLRYPQDLFSIQTNMFNKYHMNNPNVFYNNEDLWEIPQENYAGESIDMEPYYTLLNLPGDEDKNNFLIMQPFTPNNKDNMIAWLGGKANGDLVLYSFPKQKLVYGPRQIEARIDQESIISEQLSLWNQQGSRVIRGNLLTIPVDESILYVEPVYLQADNGQLPELKRIIAAYGDKVVMARNLETLFLKLFGIEQVPGEELPKEEQEIITQFTSQQLIGDLISTYETAQEHLKDGEWEEYGERIEELEKMMEDLKGKTE
ncbi:MAG: UPF0182 family protein [Bacillota bacterium]